MRTDGVPGAQLRAPPQLVPQLLFRQQPPWRQQPQQPAQQLQHFDRLLQSDTHDQGEQVQQYQQASQFFVSMLPSEVDHVGALQQNCAEHARQCSAVDPVGCWVPGGPLSLPDFRSADVAVDADLLMPRLEGGSWPQQTLLHHDRFMPRDRIEELSNYIRAQSQECLEIQAEASRQIAEVRSDCQRELDKLRREKENVECHARQELMRLQRLLTFHGIEVEPGVDSTKHCKNLLANSSGSCAAGVAMEEHQRVQRECAVAEERVRQLEHYIKEQSVKSFMCGDGAVVEKDGGIQKLNRAAQSGGAELAQVRAEFQEMKESHPQQVLTWERGLSNLLAAADQCLGRSPSYHSGGDLGAGAVGTSAVGGGPGEGCDGTRFGRTAAKISLNLTKANGATADVKDLRNLLKEGLQHGQKQQEAAALKGRSASLGAAHVVSQLAGELRQLLATAQAAVAQHRATGGKSDGCVRLRKLVESFDPARRIASQNVIAVEKIMRRLERHLRGHCDALFGRAVFDLPDGLDVGDEDAVAAARSSVGRQLQSHEGHALALVVLRQAQQLANAALVEFLNLPRKLKTIFDLAKELTVEVSKLVPANFEPAKVIQLAPSTHFEQAKAHAPDARIFVHRHAVHSQPVYGCHQSMTSQEGAERKHPKEPPATDEEE